MSEMRADVPTTAGPRVREALSDSIKYWETRRIVDNVILALIVLGYFVVNWPRSQAAVSLEGVLAVFVLAVLANICYCTAYVADVFVQLSGFRDTWRKCRWMLFLVGLTLAGIITRWFAMSFFTS